MSHLHPGNIIAYNSPAAMKKTSINADFGTPKKHSFIPSQGTTTIIPTLTSPTAHESENQSLNVIKAKVKKTPRPKSPEPATSRRSLTPATQTLIHVLVTNRLGTKFNVPCSPSDSIGDFKKLVAFYSGTKSDAILLKRQGMRPFRNSLTLEDYEIGDGSSVDMEADTGE